MYEETDQYQPVERYAQAPEQEMPGSIISTSQAINLTCTLASISTLLALFLCFADQRSRAVRRYAVQSVGMGAVHLAAGMICWIFGAIFGAIPIVGFWLFLLLIVGFVVFTLAVIVQRVRLMFHAYRGVAFVLPVIGEKLRRFE